MEIVLKLLDWSLPQHWALGLPFLCFMALMFMPAFRDTAQNPKDRDRWLKGLRDNSPAEFYRSVMRGGLDWLDTRLSSLEAQQGPAQKTWSYGLLNITMVLALAYPILAMMAQWLWGHAIDFGGQEMIAASPPQARIFALGWLGSVSICLFFSVLSQSRWSLLWLILAMGIFILGSIYADDFAVPRNVGGFAGAVAGVEERPSNPMVVRLFSCGFLLAFWDIAIKMPDDFGAGQRTQAVFSC